jgi:hypothetical protein
MPEAWRDTSCLVVAALRIVLEVESSIILVNPGKAKAYVHGTGIRVINGVKATPGK